jgi:hypothetical protein
MLHTDSAASTQPASAHAGALNGVGSHPATITAAPKAIAGSPVTPAVGGMAGSLAAIRAKPAKERARWAAAWVARGVHIKPTNANAAAIFHVSQPYISTARRGGTDDSKPAPVAALSKALNRMTSEQQEAVRRKPFRHMGRARARDRLEHSRGAVRVGGAAPLRITSTT